MSTLWTPGGGEPNPVQGEPARPSEPGPGPDPGPSMSPEMSPEAAAEMNRIRSEIASVAVADHIANHAIGLWQLAIIHLSPEEPRAAQLDEARLAIDAMACLVDGLGADLGENAETLQEALSQLRLAYVEISEQVNT